MSRTIRMADLFCGAGGTTTGAVKALRAKGYEDIELIAINHWNVAIATHSANHPWARHLCESLDNVDPRKLVPGGQLDLMVASPECTHHSRARGGKPMSDQSRASAWHVLRWAEALYIENILIENVPEFTDWGPLAKNGRPIVRKRGELFNSFIGALQANNYQVEWRVLNCANYGDPTTRERLFIMARRGKRVRWPDYTHFKDGGRDLFGERPKWRAAREIIDWDNKGKSIFARKKPLSPNTIRRIMKGLERFCNIPASILEPYIVEMYGTGSARSVDDPLTTVTAQSTHHYLAEPFFVEYRGAELRGVDEPVSTVVGSNTRGLVQPFILNLRGNDGYARGADIDQPLPTVTGHPPMAICEPFILPYRGEREGQEPRVHDIDEPMPATTTVEGHALVEPFLVTAGGATGQGRNPHDIDEPMGTVMPNSRQALVQPFLLQMDHSRDNRVHNIDNPAPAITSADAMGVVQPFLTTVTHGKNDTRSFPIDGPVPTITAIDDIALAEPFLVGYHRTGKEQSLDDPLTTVTTKDRHGLVIPIVGGGFVILDILFRMLTPREYARAQGFPDEYEFSGTREKVVKQIGNAVPINTASALVSALLS